jgi:hypothetical protein
MAINSPPSLPIDVHPPLFEDKSNGAIFPLIASSAKADEIAPAAHRRPAAMPVAIDFGDLVFVDSDIAFLPRA